MGGRRHMLLQMAHTAVGGIGAATAHCRQQELWQQMMQGRNLMYEQMSHLKDVNGGLVDGAHDRAACVDCVADCTGRGRHFDSSLEMTDTFLYNFLRQAVSVCLQS